MNCRDAIRIGSSVLLFRLTIFAPWSLTSDPRVADLVKVGKIRAALAFIEEAKRSGLVQRAIERAGLSGVQVAGPDSGSTK